MCSLLGPESSSHTVTSAFSNHRLLHPIILMAFIHLTDVTRKTNYDKLVVHNPTPSLSCHLSHRRYQCLTLQRHTLPCVSASWAVLMDEAGHISLTHTEADSHTVGHLWERLVPVIKAQCSLTQRQWEGRGGPFIVIRFSLRLDVSACTFQTVFKKIWTDLLFFYIMLLSIAALQSFPLVFLLNDISSWDRT